MDKSKKLIFSVIFLAVVCMCSVAIPFLLPQSVSQAEALPETPTGAGSIVAESEISAPIPDSETEKDEVRIGPAATPIEVYANDKNHTLTAEEKEKYPQLTNIPTLYIELEHGTSYRDIQHSVFSDATYTLVDGDNGIVEQPMGIGGRGNYSWNMSSKKTYALRLDEKADLLGMGAAKRWVLISGYNDRTLMRNYMTLTFSRNIGMEYAPECRHIDLYLNGRYFGNYLLVEKIQIHDQRVNIDPDLGGLFEIERTFRHGDCTYCIQCPSGVHIMYKSPDVEDIGVKLKNEYLKKFKNLFVKADIAISKGHEYYSRYIDVDSFIDWYIVNEFVKNYDSGFTTSCYCWVDNNGIIHMGPVWDYDTCMANQRAELHMTDPEGYHVAQPDQSWSAQWYVMLLQDENFVQLLSERWTELVDNGMLDWFFDEWYVHDEVIAESVVLNYEAWPASLDYHDRSDMRTYTHEDEIEYVINFMSARYNWFCDQWYLGDEKPYRDTEWYEIVEEYENSRRRRW